MKFKYFAGIALCTLLGCQSGGSSSSAPSITYSSSTGIYRVGEAITINVPSLSQQVTISSFSIDPALPTGLSFDSSTGTISGTPTTQQSVQSFTITATLSDLTELQTTLDIVIGPSLLSDFESMAAGYYVEEVATGLSVPVRMAVAPDGRIFYNELSTGNTRVIDASGNLLPTPFSSFTVLSGDHKGLLGLVLDPNFDQNGYVYLSMCSPASGPQLDRVRIVRLTDSSNVGTNLTILVDDLPMGMINNGGDMVFDNEGKLFFSMGDTNDSSLAQDDASLAGKILRYNADGTIPSNNPDPASAEWCRGLRNTFGLAVHQTTGNLFGTDNGPDSDDELNFLQSDKNFEWGYVGELGGFGFGFTIQEWSNVITPTAILFHNGVGSWSALKDDLFLTSYSDEKIIQMKLSGQDLTTVQQTIDFAELETSGIDNIPLHLAQASDGSIYLATFSKIYRIRKFY